MAEQQAIAAAKDGDVATLERLLETGALGPGITDALGAGLVHHATRTGHLDCVKFLVQQAKLPSNQRAHNGATPVHDAAATGSLAELCWLVREGGCGLQDQDASGVSPLHLAARFGHPALVEWLLQEGHEATLETLEGALPLHHAAISGDLTCLKLLVAVHRSSVNQRTCSGASPLYLACQEGHLHLAQFLVKDCGADVHLRALDGMSALHAAAARGHYSLVVWLVTFTDIGLTSRDNEGATALHFAARGGHTPILDRLLLMGAPITRDSWGGTPLHDAAENGQMEVLCVLGCHRALRAAAEVPSSALAHGYTKGQGQSTKARPRTLASTPRPEAPCCLPRAALGQTRLSSQDPESSCLPWLGLKKTTWGAQHGREGSQRPGTGACCTALAPRQVHTQHKAQLPPGPVVPERHGPARSAHYHDVILKPVTRATEWQKCQTPSRPSSPSLAPSSMPSTHWASSHSQLSPTQAGTGSRAAPTWRAGEKPAPAESSILHLGRLWRRERTHSEAGGRGLHSGLLEGFVSPSGS